MKFAAQLMQFMVLIPAATLCFLPMKNQLAAPPKKIIACIGLVLAIMIPVSALILTAGGEKGFLRMNLTVDAERDIWRK